MARKEKVRCIGKRRGVLQLGISFQAENLLRELAIMKWGLGFPEFLEPRVQLIIHKRTQLVHFDCLMLRCGTEYGGLGFPEFLEAWVQLIIQTNPAGQFRLLNFTMWHRIRQNKAAAKNKLKCNCFLVKVKLKLFFRQTSLHQNVKHLVGNTRRALLQHSLKTRGFYIPSVPEVLQSFFNIALASLNINQFSKS